MLVHCVKGSAHFNISEAASLTSMRLIIMLAGEEEDEEEEASGSWTLRKCRCTLPSIA